jgi:hypothetical protein
MRGPEQDQSSRPIKANIARTTAIDAYFIKKTDYEDRFRTASGDTQSVRPDEEIGEKEFRMWPQKKMSKTGGKLAKGS